MLHTPINHTQSKIPIYLINLKRSPERKQKMDDQFIQLGLNYQWIVGVDGKHLCKEQKKKYSKRLTLLNHSREMVANEIGCAYSHFATYKEIIANNHSHALILEDDGILDKDLIPVLNKVIESGVEFDMLNLKTDVEQKSIQKINDTHQLTALMGYANRLSAYCISLETAKLFVKNFFPIRYLADDFTHMVRQKYKLKYYGIQPCLVTLNNVQSDIWQGSSAWKEMKKAPILIQKAAQIRNKVFPHLKVY